jgi:hypothetical protein
MDRQCARLVRRGVPTLLLLLGIAPPSPAQTALDLMRFQPTLGILQQGSSGSATFYANFTDFGGVEVTRTGGDLDVDPSFMGGIEGTYRLNSTFTLAGSWLHSRGRYRVTFPSLSRDPGEFDLEGFILAAQDFSSQQTGGVRAESAMSDAVSDVFMLSGTAETARMGRRFFPFATFGVGLFRQVSDGPVFEFEFDGSAPPGTDIAAAGGYTLEQTLYGLPLISVDETNPLVSLGVGLRASLGSRWGCEVRVDDLMRINPDLESLRGSVPPPDENTDLGPFPFQIFAVSVEPNDAAIIHNLAFRVSVGYAIWPFGAPR